MKKIDIESESVRLRAELLRLKSENKKLWIIFKLYRQISEDDMIDQIFERHARRQLDMNGAFEKQILMC